MLKYIRGYVKILSADNRMLVVELAGCKNVCTNCKNPHRVTGDGQPFSVNELEEALIAFKKFINTVCFVGGEDDQYELKELCKYVHKQGLHTCLSTAYTDISIINKNLVDELEYIFVGRCDTQRTLLKKDYCPFADADDWIEVKNTNIP